MTRSKRQRNYKAEYARRVASATARGKTRAEARGHKAEPAEKKARRARIKQEYGVSPERLTRLRREAARHVEISLYAVSKRPADPAAIQHNMRLLPPAALAEVAGMSATEIQGLAALSYDALIELYPEYENDEERNPWWYGAL